MINVAHDIITMKRLTAFAVILLLCVVSLNSQSFLRITQPATEESSVTNIMEPILVEGVCSQDVKRVEIQYRFIPTSEVRNAEAREPVLVDTYILKKYVMGSGTFFYRIFPSLGNLGCGTNEYTIVGVTDSGMHVEDKITVFSSFFFGEKAKPVIYLYPEQEMAVQVNVRPLAGVSVSYPPLEDGWSVIAHPDGKIINKVDGKVYPYLFWESPDESLPFTHQDGFLVSKDRVSLFFHEKLAVLGLIDQEIEDFLEFWTGALDDYPWYHFHFLSQDEIDHAAPLEVSPAPHTIIRIYFDYRGLEEPEDIPEQTLHTSIRQGFSVVEWGGRRYRNH
jgi:hypothetical protein